MRLLAAAALLLLSMLTLTSASAVKTATATNNIRTVTVTSTESAMLELRAGTSSANAGSTAQTASGQLVLDFTRISSGSGGYGFPRSPTGYTNSVTYKHLFTITNTSQDPLCVYVYVPGGGVPDLSAIVLRNLTTLAAQTTAVSGGGRGSACLPVSPMQQAAVDFYWLIQSSSAAPTFNVRVEGVRNP